MAKAGIVAGVGPLVCFLPSLPFWSSCFEDTEVSLRRLIHSVGFVRLTAFGAMVAAVPHCVKVQAAAEWLKFRTCPLKDQEVASRAGQVS